MSTNPFVDFMNDPLTMPTQFVGYIDKIYNAPRMTCSQMMGPDSVNQVLLDNRADFELMFRTGSAGLPRVSARSARSGQKIPDKIVSSTVMHVPHYDMQDVVLADDFLGKRKFGDNAEFTRDCISEKVSEKIQAAYDAFALVREYNLWQSICGYVKSGLSETLLDVYSTLGLTRKNFTLDFSGSIFDQILDVITYQQGALAGTISTGAVAFCSPSFYKKLSTDAAVVEANKYQNSEFLRNLNLNGFMYHNVYWILYNEYTASEGTVYPWLPAGTAKVVPMGVPGLIDEVCAPADTVQGLTEDTKPQYSMYRLNRTETGFDIDCQMNAVMYCTRPETIVTLTDGDHVDSAADTAGMFVPPVQDKKRR